MFVLLTLSETLWHSLRACRYGIHLLLYLNVAEVSGQTPA